MFEIRLINTSDAAAALAVYASYVLTTAYTFEYEVPTVGDFKKKIEKLTAQHPWLVCEYNGEMIGYAYGSTQHERPGYRWTTETTIYMKQDFHGKGIARILYTALFDILKLQGYYTVYANVLSTNTRSCKFHKSMGFEEIGIYRNIGYKLGQWQSNLGMQYFLQEHIAEPPTPKSITTLIDAIEIENILEEANKQLAALSFG